MRLGTRARRIGVYLLLLNVLLIGLKLAALSVTNSIALQTEITNSAVDIIYSFITVIGLTLATRSPTETYPEGFRKLEPLVALIIALGILFTSSWLIIISLREITTPTATILTPAAITALLLTIGFKLGIFYYCRKSTIESPIITATAHDSLTDTLTATVALLGIALADLGYPAADGIAGIAVALSIGYVGITITRSNLRHLLGGQPDTETKAELVETALTHTDVQGVHDTVVHHNGPALDISMHLEVEGGIPIEHAHQIEYTVADRLRDTTDYDVNEINLHLDPQTLGEWETTPTD